MLFQRLADLILLVHLTFVAFVVLGGLLVLRWPKVGWAHLPAAAWGVFTEYAGIHDDVHAMNIMCSSSGELLALIDWGDAGWGDPALDFAAIPFDDVPSALEGYEVEAPGLLGRDPEARIAWNKLLDALDDLWEAPARPLDLVKLYRLMREGRLRAG